MQCNTIILCQEKRFHVTFLTYKIFRSRLIDWLINPEREIKSQNVRQAVCCSAKYFLFLSFKMGLSFNDGHESRFIQTTIHRRGFAKHFVENDSQFVPRRAL